MSYLRLIGTLKASTRNGSSTFAPKIEKNDRNPQSTSNTIINTLKKNNEQLIRSTNELKRISKMNVDIDDKNLKTSTSSPSSSKISVGVGFGGKNNLNGFQKLILNSISIQRESIRTSNINYFSSNKNQINFIRLFSTTTSEKDSQLDDSKTEKENLESLETASIDPQKKPKRKYTKRQPKQEKETKQETETKTQENLSQSQQPQQPSQKPQNQFKPRFQSYSKSQSQEKSTQNHQQPSQQSQPKQQQQQNQQQSQDLNKEGIKWAPVQKNRSADEYTLKLRNLLWQEGLSKAELSKRATSIFRGADRENRLTTATLKSLIQLYSKADDLDMVSRMYSIFREKRYMLDAQLYVALMKLNQTNPTEVEALLREMHIKKFYPTQEIAQIYFSSFIAQHDFELTFSKFKSWCDTSLGNAINRVELCLFILDQMLHIQKSHVVGELCEWFLDRENVTIDDLFKILFLTISHDYPPIALTVLPRLKPAVLDEGVANALLLMALRFSNISLLEMIWPLDSPIPKFLPSIEYRGLYITRVYCYLNSYKIRPAFKAAQDMSDAGYALTPGEKSFLEAVLEQKVENLDESFYEVQAIFKSRKRVDISLVNSIIQACSQVDEHDRAFDTFSALESLDLQPNIDTIHALLEGCARALDYDTATSLLALMRQKPDLKPTAKTYELLLAISVRSMRLQQAMSMIEQEMKSDNIEPQDVHYRIVCKGLIRQGNLILADQVLKKLKNPVDYESLKSQIVMKNKKGLSWAVQQQERHERQDRFPFDK